jgi:tetratricopeptide (TPR) repeat protein
MTDFGRFVIIGFVAGCVGGPTIACADGTNRESSAPQTLTHTVVTVAARANRDDSTAPAAKPDPAPVVHTREQKLDDLFARLAASKDAAESNGLVVAIDRLYLESGSDTGDLLMARAISAIGARNLAVSLTLLDKIIVLRPDWAEAWNKRATVRYLMDDDKGSMADIARVLSLEPRHIGALSGMATILERAGFTDDALRTYRRALEIAPQLPSVRAAVDRLTAAAKGQSL